MPDIIYERKGLAPRSLYLKVALCNYHALFKHENDDITYVTFVRNTWKYNHTRIHVKIRTFYDMRIAYIEKMNVIHEDTEYFDDDEEDNENIFERDGIHYKDNYLLPYLTPDGIDELRFKDGPYLYEVFLLWRNIYMNLTRIYPITAIMSDNTDMPLDVIDKIITLSISNNKDKQTVERDDEYTPFKVQGYKHGSKKAEYRVVRIERPNAMLIEDGYTARWFDM